MVDSRDFPECFTSEIGELIQNIKEINNRTVYISSFYEETNKLPNPDGVHCIICGKELPKRRRSYCSDECFDSWYKAKIKIKDWNYVRKKAMERDNYACVKCGLKPMTKSYEGIILDKEILEPDESQLVIDHKIPIAIGGKEFDLDNLQTLCLKCNKIKTKIDQKNIAWARGVIKMKHRGQKQLGEIDG